jgi:hypothetical protein
MNLSPINNFNPSPQDKIAAANAQRNANLSSTQNAQSQNNSDNTKVDAEKQKSDSYTTPDSQSQHLNNRQNPADEANKAPSQAEQYQPTDKPITSIEHEASQPKQVDDPTKAETPVVKKKTWTDWITEGAMDRLKERGGQNMQQTDKPNDASLPDSGKPSPGQPPKRPEQQSPSSTPTSPQIPGAQRPKFSAPPRPTLPKFGLPKFPRIPRP